MSAGSASVASESTTPLTVRTARASAPIQGSTEATPHSGPCVRGVRAALQSRESHARTGTVAALDLPLKAADVAARELEDILGAHGVVRQRGRRRDEQQNERPEREAHDAVPAPAPATAVATLAGARAGPRQGTAGLCLVVPSGC